MCEEYLKGFCIVCGQPRVPAVRIPKDYGVGIIIPNMDIKRNQKHLILTPRELGKTWARKQFINEIKGLRPDAIDNITPIVKGETWGFLPLKFLKKSREKLGDIEFDREYLEEPMSDDLDEQSSLSK